MTVPASYLEYPLRKYGMDHDRYDWSITFRREPVEWPGKARVALWVSSSLQRYPMDLPSKPIVPPGGYNRPYPDFRNYSHRDYGSRLGIFRLMRVLDDFGIKATVPMNSAIATRYPQLLEEIDRRGWEIIGHGVHMGRMHYGGMDRQHEAELVEEALSTLRSATGQPVRGWLSIGRSQSENTPELIAANGIEYCCDWANDDMPYEFRTSNGNLWAMPFTQEIDDRHILLDLKHREHEYVQQLKDCFDLLYKESETYGGRVMSISLHPWVIGHPYRISYLREALGYILGHEGVWAATGGEILDAFLAQAGRPRGEG